ncbi:histidine kinase dimerization/phospho-acceptor domain-containing protein [Clostridium culturomicium]|uniref:histidine kinase dimerization/phospho-acceptor domain-containing protein n=1 Tax=Clostridium culturomicium TaxID=1499683 RepID=UPI0038577A28
MKYYIVHNSATAEGLSEERDKIRELISDISHQTKTPIVNILLYSSLLKEVVDDKECTKEILEQICTSSEKLNFLIGALIKISRLETGIISVNAIVNSVGEMLEKILNQI